MLFLSYILSQLIPRTVFGLENICRNSYCNLHGYCSEAQDDSLEPTCDCFDGYDGLYCEFNVKGIACFNMDCGFSGLQGECIIGPTNEASCYCYSEWEGNNCENRVTETIDFCADVTCNDRGACFEDWKLETKWTCVCDPGWSGQSCGTQLHECGHDFLLDIFTRLSFLSDDLGSASECGYSKPVIFSAVAPAESDPFTYPYCICASLLERFGASDYEHLLRTCNMDAYRPLPFIKEAESYCPGCNEYQDAIMEDVITTKSAACYHFVYQRATMGLYWRSRWKCGCIMDIGNFHSTSTIVTCPFTQHTSKSDMISYDNCGSRKICDWESMYIWFEKVFSKVNLDGSVACKDWMEAWIFTIPGEQRFEFMEDTFCPCLDYLKAVGEDYQTILDCIPVTFHQLTMLDLYNEICYDPLIQNVDCLNFIGYSAIQLGAKNYTAASLCYGAVELSSSLDSMTDNLHTLSCDCIVPLYNDNYTLGDTMLSALDCVNEYFTFEITSCENYDKNTIDYVDRYESDESHKRSAGVVSGSSFSTSLLSTSTSWETVTIIETPLSVVLFMSAIYLQRRKMKLK